MVTELKDVSNLLKNFAIHDEIDGKCSKCVGDFKHPVELPCRHILCFSCVVDCCKKSFAENIKCPSCASKVNFPLGSIKNLPIVCPNLTHEEIDSILKNARQRVKSRRIIELDGSFVEDESFEVIDSDSSDCSSNSIAILSGSSFENLEESITKTETTETESRLLSDFSEVSSNE
ncbi:unnamed protein product [Oikopleura dioica]|uniref:RING-type domain-containing protein n=1 Tax=Oikopleura dioica TaxID=34765 RepID=E4XCP9_OIKDI|nr:unnamed protein product [Oikopleura dioica]